MNRISQVAVVAGSLPTPTCHSLGIEVGSENLCDWKPHGYCFLLSLLKKEMGVRPLAEQMSGLLAYVCLP